MPHYRGTAYVHVAIDIPVDRIAEDDTIIREEIEEEVERYVEARLDGTPLDFSVSWVNMGDVIETPRGDGPDSGQH